MTEPSRSFAITGYNALVNKIASVHDAKPVKIRDALNK